MKKDDLIKKIFPDKILNAKNKTKNYQKFLILSSPRTGSHWLTSLLRSREDVIIFREPFNPRNIGWIGFGDYNDSSGDLLRYREGNIKEFIDDVIFCSYPVEIKAIGFKMHDYEHPINNATFVWAVINSIPNLKIIRLKRKNKFEQYVSLELAKETNIWQTNNTNKKNKSAQMKIKINRQDCLNFFYKMEYLDNLFEKIIAGKDVYTLYYEDLCSEQKRHTDSIQKFLKFDKKILTSNINKLNNRRMSDIVINYKEIKNGLKDTKWINFFGK